MFLSLRQHTPPYSDRNKKNLIVAIFQLAPPTVYNEVYEMGFVDNGGMRVMEFIIYTRSEGYPQKSA